MNKYLKGLILAVMTLSTVLATSAHAEDKQMRQEFRVGPWYDTTDNQKNKQQLDVVVELPGGMPPLLGNNLKLRINGKDVTEALSVQSFEQSGQELAWVVCIESASALSKPFLKTTQSALLSLFKDRQSLQIALFTFGANLNKTLTFEKNTNPAALTQSIEKLKSQGDSKIKLYQSLMAALDYYEQAALTGSNLPKRKRILVIAQGSDQGSSANYENVVDRARALGIPIDAVGIKPSKKSHTDAAHLDMIADATGGRFVLAADETDLADALTNLHRLLTETKTIVTSFQYDPDRKLMAERAEVVLQLPSSIELIASLDAKNLPVPKVEVPAQQPPPKRQPQTSSLKRFFANINWLLFLGLPLAGSMLYWYLRIHKPQIKSQEGNESQTVVIIGSSDSNKRNLLPSETNLDRKTVVGGQIQPQSGNGIWLEGIGGAVQGLKIHINKPIFTIGANADNDLVIANDDYVSSKHAIIRCDNGSYFIIDQNSRNGIFVNDVRVPSSAYALGFGNRIRIGGSVFEVRKTGG